MSPLPLVEKINWLRLARSENIGPATFFRLLNIFKTASKTLEKINDFCVIDGVRRQVKIASLKIVETEIEKAEKFGAKIVTFYEDDYPRLLREIYDPSPVLTMRGDTSLLKKDIVAIVGARNGSFHACQFAQEMAQELSNEDVIIASGLAHGIDASAHRGALEGGTIAVIASGIDRIYPKENTNLYKQIFNKGLIITEQPFSAPVQNANFILRNRIISGISYGVIVVEAGPQSGSLTTARFALEQGREVYGIPGFPGDMRNKGSNNLIEQGAIFTQSYHRVMSDMNAMRLRFSQAGLISEPEEEIFANNFSNIPSESDIKKVRDEILEKIGFVGMQIEQITKILQTSSRLVNIALVQLELAEKVEIKYGYVTKR